MNRPDVYYGPIAASYQSSREVKAKWKIEQAAVEAFLTDGPVLDVPFGTGRFVPLYRSKGLSYSGIDISGDMLEQARARYGDVNAHIGSVFDLRCGDNEFATAVCVRFLEWLPLDRARLVIDRLRRAAGILIVTIVHGEEGQPEAYTYDFGKFLGVIDGLLIEDRRVTANVRGMISEVFKLRPARWSDVLDQFRPDYGDAAPAHVQRLADKFGMFFDVPGVPVNEVTATVRMEYWSGAKVGETVQALSEHRFVVDAAPRRMDRPATVIERQGRRLMIDGRRRANQWMKAPGPHPILVVRTDA